MLYTIIPMEEVFRSSTETDGTSPSETILQVDGKQVLCQRDSHGKWRMERLLSTDPNDYIDPRWQPGTIVRGF